MFIALSPLSNDRPSFFDPGHGFLSSVDERIIAIAALVLFAIIGGIAEYLGDARGLSVVGVLLGYIVGIVLWAPPFLATEWHYAVAAATPIVIIIHVYRRRGD